MPGVGQLVLLSGAAGEGFTGRWCLSRDVLLDREGPVGYAGEEPSRRKEPLLQRPQGRSLLVSGRPLFQKWREKDWKKTRGEKCGGEVTEVLERVWSRQGSEPTVVESDPLGSLCLAHSLGGPGEEQALLTTQV